MMDIDKPEAKRAPNVPNQAPPPIKELANVFNESAFAYIKHRDAEKELNQAREELEKLKPTFQALPGTRLRCENKVSTAYKASIQAKEAERTQSKKLDEILAEISNTNAKAASGIDTAAAKNVPTGGSHDDFDDKDFKLRFKEVFASLFQGERDRLKNEFSSQRKRMEERVEILSNTYQAQVDEYENRFQQIKEEQRLKLEEHEQRIASRLEAVEDVQKRVELDLKNFSTLQTQLMRRMDELDGKLHELAARVLLDASDLQQPISGDPPRVTIDDPLPKLAVTLEMVRSQGIKNRDALKKSEGHLEEIYNQLSMLSSASEKVRSSNDSTSPSNVVPTATAALSSEVPSKLVDLEDKIDSMHDVIEIRSTDLVNLMNEHNARASSRFEKLEDDMATLGSSMGRQIDSSKDELLLAMTNYARIEVIASLEAAIASLRNDLNSESFSRVPLSQLETQVEGAMMSLKQLSKKVDDHSPEEIVSRINMNLRNVNLGQLQMLQARVSQLTEGLQSMRIEVNSIKEPNGALTPTVARNHNMPP